MNNDIFMQLCAVQGRVPLLQPAVELFAVNGNPLYTLGCTEIKFDNWPVINVTVVKGIKHYLIIGNDTLNDANASINYCNNCIMLWGSKFD